MDILFSLHGIPLSLSSGDENFIQFFGNFMKEWAATPIGSRSPKRGQPICLSLNNGTVGMDVVPGGALTHYRYNEVSAFTIGDRLVLLNDASSHIIVDPLHGTAGGKIAPKDMTYERFATFFSLLLSELLRARGFFYLHSACLCDRKGRGWLICGWPGSGKSTLSLGFLGAGFSYLSDDAVLLTRARSIEALSLRKTVRIASGRRRKHSVDMESRFPDRYKERCSPGIMLHTGVTKKKKSALIPLSPHQSFLSLVPQSFQILGSHRWARDHAAVLTDLAEQCVSFRLDAGTDVLRTPERVIGMVEER